MDPRLHRPYGNEPTHLRAIHAESACESPKTAAQWGMEGGEATDPYAERMRASAGVMTNRGVDQ